jgi:beta-lactamase regulating signal transducer with metallopeptidase domain
MENFILYTLKSSLCLSAGYLFYYFLLRRDTFHRFKRFMLIGIIVCSLLVPLIRINLKPTVINIPVQKLESTIVTETPVTKVTQQTTVPAMPVQPQHSTIRLLPLVYLMGAGLQAILIMLALARIVIIFRKSEKIKYGKIRLAVTPSAISPFCFGRHILISRKDLEENINAILLHEKTHLEKGHNLDLFLLEAYLVITWYNPFSWLIRRELKQNHEFEADRNVLRQGIDDSDYQLLLVRTVAGEQRYRLANPFNQSNLKTRIAMMNKRRSNSLATLKAALFLPLIVLMVQAFAQKVSPPATSSQDSSGMAKYLVLKPEQLKNLGFEYNTEGLFYKNERPNQVQYKELDLIFTKKVYSSSILVKKGEKAEHFTGDKIINKMTATTYDFFPVVVSNFRGHQTLTTAPVQKYEKKKLLPVQVNMADLKISGRSDTLVFWFLPTESLKNALSWIKIEDYLQLCPPDTREVKEKSKK